MPGPRAAAVALGPPDEASGRAALAVGDEPLGQVRLAFAPLGRLAEALPTLDGTVILGDSVHRAFRVSLNGERFVSDPATLLDANDRLLLLAADMGG